jgi:hypothetical protein
LGNQIDVVMVEDEDELDPFDNYNSKALSISESIDGIFNSAKSSRWYL